MQRATQEQRGKIAGGLVLGSNYKLSDAIQLARNVSESHMQAALDVLDAAIDGRNLAQNSRLGV